MLHNSSYRVEFQMIVSGRGSIEIHGVAPFIDVRFDGGKSAKRLSDVELIELFNDY